MINKIRGFFMVMILSLTSFLPVQFLIKRRTITKIIREVRNARV